MIGYTHKEMPTVAREDGYHVVVYTDNHPPPHVHVRKDGADIKILLLPDSVTLHSVKGNLSDAKIRTAGRICARLLNQCWTTWRKFYG